MLPCNYFEERLRNERTGRQESWIVRLSDVCRARAGQASRFEHEQWVMHSKHTAYSHIESRRECVVMWGCVHKPNKKEYDESRKRRLAAGVARHGAGWEGQGSSECIELMTGRSGIAGEACWTGLAQELWDKTA
jgi:hypothetical protein